MSIGLFMRYLLSSTGISDHSNDCWILFNCRLLVMCWLTVTTKAVDYIISKSCMFPSIANPNGKKVIFFFQPCDAHELFLTSRNLSFYFNLWFLRSCAESFGQQAQAVWTSRFRASVYAGGHSQQGLVLLWHRAAHAQWHRPGGWGRHQTTPPVCQAEAQVPGEEEYHHHLRHRQSKDKLTYQNSGIFDLCKLNISS